MTRNSEGRVGDRLGGRYSLMRVVASGGMGTVWAARDHRLGRDVAVKEIRGEGGMLAGLQEARLAARVSHPHVVRVFDVLLEDGKPWIVMPLLPNRTLAAVLAEDGPLPARTAARMALDVLAALGAVHAAGVVHRDVKPSNIVLSDDGHAVLVDFGIATSIGDARPVSPAVLVGSPAYLPPERARGQDEGTAGDLWSLGAVLFTAVQGRAPFARDEPVATITALLSGPVPEADRAGSLAPVIAGLLATDPRDRLGVEEARRMVLLALLAAIDGPEPQPDPQPTQPLWPPPGRSGRMRPRHGEVAPADGPDRAGRRWDGGVRSVRGATSAGTGRHGTRQGRV